MAPEELKQARESLCLTQAAFGAEVGISRTWVNLMENGRTPITQRTAKAVTNLLKARGT